MNRLFAALAAVLFLATGSARAAEPHPVTRYVLGNGLEVVLVPDRRVPKVVMNLLYRVGALNEPAGRSGFAHLFEHLMFSGTEAWPRFDDSTLAVGLINNASTWEDKTIYYMEGLSSTLPLMLAVEADRMANLGRSVDQRELDVQRAVVKNEMRQNVIDEPYATGWEVMWTSVFPKSHPYSRTVLGSLADLDAATLDDVQGFFNTYYVPNNAILVLTGDIDVEKTRALVEDTFGRVPRGADVARPQVTTVEPTRVRLEFEDRIPSLEVGIVFAGPHFSAPENGALTVAGELLGNPEYGILRNRMVATGVSTFASSEWVPGYLGGRFYVEAGAAEGVTEAVLEAELRASLEELLAGPNEADVERAKRTILLSQRVAREPLKVRAETIVQMTDMLDQPELALVDDPQVAGVAASDIRDVARRILKLDDASVMVIRPGQRGGYPATFTESSGVPQPFTALPRPVVEVPKLAVGEPVAAQLPKMETATLSNGIRIVHYAMSDAPMAYVAVAGAGGWTSAPAGKEGLLSMASSMAYRGAGTRDYASFAKAAKDIGANVGSYAGHQSTMVTLSAPPETFEAGVALLADSVLRPRFDQAEWTIAVTEALDSLAAREADLPKTAARAAEKILFAAPPGKPQFDWSAETVKAMSLADARDAFHAVFKPAGTTFYSVGPVPLERVKASLESAFGGWKDDAPGVTPEAQGPAAFPDRQRVLLVPEPGASQSALYVARGAPGFGEPHFAESVAVLRLLGDDFTSRLNSVIREEKGYSYGVYGHVKDRIRNGSAMVIETTVERDFTGPALAEFFRGFDSLAATPVTQEELDRTITAYHTAIAGTAETSAGLFAEVTSRAGDGMTLEDGHGQREAATRLQLDAVRGQAAGLAPLDRALFVVAGDPDVVIPQLAEIGLKNVEILQRSAKPAAEDRAVDLDGEEPSDQAQPAPDMPGSTRGIHACPAGNPASNCRDAAMP